MLKLKSTLTYVTVPSLGDAECLQVPVNEFNAEGV